MLRRFKPLATNSKEGPEMVNQSYETFIDHPGIQEHDFVKEHPICWIKSLIMISKMIYYCIFRLASPCYVLFDGSDYQCCSHHCHTSSNVQNHVARHSYPRTRREVGEEDARFRPKISIFDYLQPIVFTKVVQCNALNSWEAFRVAMLLFNN